MVYGYVFLEYATFVFGDDEFIEMYANLIADSVHREIYLKKQGYQFEYED